jgi:uncharacterized membrane protein HdeD (DUF308 family)
MHSNPVEAAMVATLMMILYLVVHGGVPIPSRFSTRMVLGWIGVIAIVLGVIAWAARWGR